MSNWSINYTVHNWSWCIKNIYSNVELNYSIIKSLRIQDIGKCLFFTVPIEDIGGKSVLAEITILNSKKEVIGLGRNSIILAGNNKQLVEAVKKTRPYLVKTIMVPNL